LQADREIGNDLCQSVAALKKRVLVLEPNSGWASIRFDVFHRGSDPLPGFREFLFRECSGGSAANRLADVLPFIFWNFFSAQDRMNRDRDHMFAKSIVFSQITIALALIVTLPANFHFI